MIKIWYTNLTRTVLLCFENDNSKSTSRTLILLNSFPFPPESHYNGIVIPSARLLIALYIIWQALFKP